MRLSCLEMEKFRRYRERASAMARVRNIDARVREIDSEEAIILLALKEQGKTGPAEAPEKDYGHNAAGAKSAGGFKLKY